ncbi:sulfotransferase family protein [Thalassovita taeanensis]|uniref:Sulfotransferase family protein n=1 Tax=Thalassovita taeanensis TaxID=657014 RepID=A0A1H9FTX5_9RHOB|nr:sulfotransferase family protein [Thalassovita taeanensis]SEQ41335.1 hypothetical protein SAMN04488092_106213 [Thalassovita taeanensis]
MTRLRVVNLGLPKSGTTTLARALKLAGLKVADYRIRRRQTDDASLHQAFVGQVLYDGYFHTGDPLSALEGFDAFTEINVLREGLSLWPQMDWGLIDAIRRHHPGTKFLASSRDPRQLSDSMLRWSNLGIERLPNNSIPGLPKGFGQTTLERVQWIKAHYAHLRQLFRDDSDFLEYDVSDSDAATKISAHIGVPLTWWGKANRNRTAQAITAGAV